MRHSFIISILLAYLIFLVAIPLNAQSVVQPIVGVNNGDTFTYQITQMEGYENVPLFTSDTGEELSFSLGDTFNMNILDSNLNFSNRILIEYETVQGSFVFSNDMENLFFSFVIFTDWVYWTGFLQTIFTDGTGIEPVQDDETFGFRIGFLIPFDQNDPSLGNAAVDIINIYDKQTGILLYQYLGIYQEENLDEPLGLYEVVQGVPIPIPDRTTLAINEFDIYKYKVNELVGFSEIPLFQGVDGDLLVQDEDIIDVSVIDTQISSGNGIDLSLSAGGNSITYSNRLDFLNPLTDISFFVFTDWDYMEEIVLLINESSAEEVTITYEFTPTSFKYKEDFTGPDGFYTYGTEYDLSNGALISQFLLLEDYNTSTSLLYEISFLERISIDTSFVGFAVNQVYGFVVTEYTASDFNPLYSSTDGNLWLFEGDIFELTLVSAPNSNNELPVKLSSSEASIFTIDLLFSFGEFVIFNDWDFWRSYWETLVVQSSQSLIITIEETESAFTVSLRIIETGIDYYESITYEKSTGVMLSRSLDVDVVNEDGGLESINLQIDRSDEGLSSTTPTTSSIVLDTTSTKSNKDESPAFNIYLTIISIMSLIMIVKKTKKLSI